MDMENATVATSPGPSKQALEVFFQPRSVALVGASERPGSVGRALMENLRAFRGRLFPINPGHDFLFDRRTFAKLADVREPVGLAIIAVKAAAVPGVIRECADVGIPAAVIVSAGFRECGAAGRELERRVTEEAARGGMRIIGPNSLGLICPHCGLNASFASTAPLSGDIAFLSQSGALCSAVLDWSRSKRIGFSVFVSMGSMLDVGWGDLIEAVGEDKQTKSILLYMESMDDARSFMGAARRVSVNKPILVLKAGRTPEAARAAASHTGALIGRDRVFDAAFRRAGIMRVDTIADLFGLAEVLATQPIPANSRLVIVTNAGGPGALAADALVLSGGRIAPLCAETIRALDGLLPPHWSRGNPIDVIGDATPPIFTRAIELALDEPDADGALAVLTPQAMTDPAGAARGLAGVASKRRKPVFAAWMGGEAVAEGRRILHAAGIPSFEYPDVAARAFSRLAQIGERRRERGIASPGGSLLEVPEEIGKRTHELLATARRNGRTLLSPYESQQVLAWNGIPMVETLLASTVDEAVAAAERLGYPIALKLHSHTVSHKSDIGGVRLGLKDAFEVRDAWRAMYRSVSDSAGMGSFQGATVQAMVPGDGREVILGASSDPQFGPVLMFGTGGRLVEVHGDSCFELPPLDLVGARRMLERSRIFAALRGVRGLVPVDHGALERLLVRFSELVLANEEIQEIETNPLVVSKGRLVGLDARIILHPYDADIPRPVLAD